MKSFIPLWQGIPEILSSKNSSEYSDRSIQYYKRVVPAGEGYSDIVKLEEYRINPDVPLEFYAWKAFQYWFEKDLDNCKTVAQIKTYINTAFTIDNTGRNVIFDRTYLNHTLNKYTFAGLLYKLKAERNDIYYFELMIKRMGIDWFRIENKYMLGTFQQERGLLDIL